MGTNWRAVAASAGATLAIVGIAIAYGLGRQSAASVTPTVVQQQVAPAAIPLSSIIAPPVQCTNDGAQQATMRGRATALRYVTFVLNFLQMANGAGSIRIVGWDTRPSNNGPPCLASFTYELNGMRREMLFNYWPGAPAHIASANQQADDAADIGDGLLLGGAINTRLLTADQIQFATILRALWRANIEDVYMSPTEADTLVVERPHCVAANVDFRVGSNEMIRLARRNRIRHVRCVADSAWAFDIPPRGAVPDPYLPGAQPSAQAAAPAPPPVVPTTRANLATSEPTPSAREAPAANTAQPAQDEHEETPAAAPVDTHHTCYRADGTPQRVPIAVRCSAMNYTDDPPGHAGGAGWVAP